MKKEQLSPPQKLAQLITYLYTDWDLSRNQLGKICGFRDGRTIMKYIIDEQYMSEKNYANIYTELARNIDVLQSLLEECGSTEPKTKE